MSALRLYVLVGGWPGSGKTTLASGLAPALGLAYLGKDAVKETLMDALGAPADVAASRRLGEVAVRLVLSIARGCPGAARTEGELWGQLVAPLGVGPLIEVDTSGPVDIATLAVRVRTTS